MKRKRKTGNHVFWLLFLFLLMEGLVWSRALLKKTEKEPENYPQGLVLMMEQCEFPVGENEETQVTVYCEEGLADSVSVMDNWDQELATIETDGSGVYHVTLSIYEEEARIGSLRAVAGDEESREVPFYVQPEVTEEMMETLLETAEDLVAYVRKRGQEYYDEAGLQAAADWLAADSRVASVEVYQDGVIYLTRDGLAGSYGMGRYEEGYLGKAKQSSLSKAYADYTAGEDLSDTYLTSRLTLTNTRLVRLAPLGYDINQRADRVLYRLSEKINGSVETWEGRDAVWALGNGTYTDSGLVLLTTHGNLLEKRDGSNLLSFQLGDFSWADFEALTEGEEGELWGSASSFDGFTGIWNRFWAGVSDNYRSEEYRLVYDATPENGEETDEEIYTILGTTNYVIQGLSDRLFDNAIIYFNVCCGASDEQLLGAFRDHGAAAFLGAKDSIYNAYAITVLEELAQDLGGNFEIEDPDEQKGLSDVALAMGFHDENVYLEMAYRCIADYFFDALGMEYEEVAAACDQSIIEVDGEWITPRELALENRQMVMDLGDEGIVHIYDFRYDDFSMSGGEDFSGQVTGIKGKPIANAEVTLYRWLDHSFHCIGTVQTDAEGKYGFENVPYGLYVAEACLEEIKGRIYLEFGKSTASIPDLILNLTGITGTVADAEDGTLLSGATVQCTYRETDPEASISERKVYKFVTGEDGTFFGLGMKPGTYTLRASKSGYTDSEEITVKLQDGEMYLLQQEIRLEEEPYYRFIREELYPRYGLVSLEKSTQVLTEDDVYEGTGLCWDKRSGLLGADIADFTGDGQEDLLVYYMGESREPENWQGYTIYPATLYAELYTRKKAGEIVRLDTIELFRDRNNQYLECTAGVFTLEGKAYLYVEEYETQYFSNGSSLDYTLYTVSADGHLRPLWQIEQPPASMDFEYDLLTDFDEDGANQREIILQYGSGRFSGLAVCEELKDTLVKLGLPRTEGLLKGCDQYRFFPSYREQEELKLSFEYLCQSSTDKWGEGGTVRNMEVTVSDATALRDHIYE